MNVLLAAVAGLFVAILLMTMIATQLQKPMDDREYVWVHFGLIAVAWLFLVLPGLRAVCSGLACRWSVSFAWWVQPLRNIEPLDKVSPTLMLFAALAIAAITTVYFFGHILAWLLYGTRRLLRLVA